MALDVLNVSLELIQSLRPSLPGIRSRDARLHDQIRSAASSIALNISEGERRTGKDRIHLWRVAAGSAAEVRTALRVAEAWGDIESGKNHRSLELLDRVIAMLWKMTH